jgi:hypothetical protein
VLLVITWLVAVPVVIWLVAGLFNRERRKRTIYSPKKLFKALCRAHRLDRSARRALTKLAAAAHIAQPATLFVSPEAFDAHLATLKRASQIALYKQLREQLFGA